MTLRDKTAIVTGGSQGIGHAVVELLMRKGATVIVADIVPINGPKEEHASVEPQPRPHFIQTDISRDDQVDSLVAMVMQRFGRVDILVNCAGIYMRGDVTQTCPADWDRLMAINLTGTFLCCRAVIPYMRKKQKGSIVNLSSSVGWQYAAPKIAAYAASKFGITGLTKAMACDHMLDGIRINAVCPGPTDTPLIRGSRSEKALNDFIKRQPTGRLARPLEIASMVVFLCEDAATFVTGAIVPVDGGQSACCG